jgi:hypothetical protein
MEVIHVVARKERVKAFGRAALRAMSHGYESPDEVSADRRQAVFQNGQARKAFLLCIVLSLGFGGILEYVLLPLTLGLAVYGVYSVARRYEGRSLRELLDFRHGSWAFLIGDVVLAVAVVFQVANWNRYEPNDARTFIALGGVLVCAQLSIWLFPRFDRRRYVKHDALLSYDAPSKYAHDIVLVSVLSAGLLVGCAPLLLVWTWHGWVALAAVVIYALLALADLYRDARGLLDPHKQYPAWDAEKFQLAEHN